MPKLAGQLTVLDVNVDDLQSGMEATSRVAVALQEETIRLDRSLGRQLRVANVLGGVVNRTKELRACLKEQRSALRELRDNIARLRGAVKAELSEMRRLQARASESASAQPNRVEMRRSMSVDDRSREIAGLCADCTHAEIVRSSKGSTFYRCRLAHVDSRFVRYPAIPVRRCDGFDRASSEG